MSKEIEALKRIETTFSMNRQGKESVYREYTNSMYPYYEDFDLVMNALKRLEEIGCSLEVREQALNGFYIDGYGYVSNDDDFIYLRKDNSGYYLKVVIHPSKPIPPDFYGYCDIHYLKDYKKTWWLREDKND